MSCPVTKDIDRNVSSNFAKLNANDSKDSSEYHGNRTENQLKIQLHVSLMFCFQ